MFRSARIKLTLAYTLAIALVMAAFSIALYLTLSSTMPNTLEVPESASLAVEHAILGAQLARARLALLGINVIGWVVAASISYIVAGRTLAPIEAALSRQRQFTAHASHELRTPLTVIKGEIDVTRARDRSPEQYRQTLDSIDEEVQGLETMVADLLALARMESGQYQADRQKGNVAEMIDDVLDPIGGGIRERGIQLEVIIPGNLEVVLDWSRIRHLFINLIDNAVQHTPRGGTIRIAAENHNRNFDLSVYNSGTAIDPADLPHLFVPFYRGKGSATYTGTGLGLALCDWIVRTHHGTIAAQNVNGGVSFHVRLPKD